MKGCFGALERAVPNHIAKRPPTFPEVHIAQCGECLLSEREFASSIPGVKILSFFLFSIIFFSY